MKNKTKKPFYKKWWVWLIAVLLIVGIGSMGDSEEETTSSNSDTKEIQDTTTEKLVEEVKEEAKEEPKETDAKIKQGTYKVGTDLPAGEYIVFADGLMTYYESASDSSGAIESIIFNGNLSENAHAYATVQDGEYLKVTGGYLYPVEKAPSVIPKDGIYENGMYKVGQDIPAGEYKVMLNSNVSSSEYGFGYLEVANSSRNNIYDIVTNEIVQADTYITVRDGQYLTLQDLKIETK